MFSPLADATFRRLFLAQVIALAGTGLASVALGLLAFALAPDRAGAVLGTALAIKMLAYVGVAPVAAAFASRLPRRGLLVAMDLVRAAIALALPFVDAVWQVYLLIFALQAASAVFTPAFQATIPDVLTDEGEYTKALSLSRLAYDIESLASPALAAALLTVIGFHWLFAGTAIGFLVSALLVLATTLPGPVPGPWRGILERTTRGLRIYLATPRLRGLLALNLSVAAAGAMVIVNTVVCVRAALGRPEADVAVALAVFGAGSMLAALALPTLLERLPDRRVMLAAAALLAAVMLGLAAAAPAGLVGWPVLLAAWLLLGAGYAAVQTPTGRLLRRSAHAEDRPALFAAQFALSHACWLATYPLAGLLGASAGLGAAFLALGSLTLLGAALAPLLWPRHDPEVIAHAHPDLPEDHPHLGGGGATHAHAFVIDEAHPCWPR